MTAVNGSNPQGRLHNKIAVVTGTSGAIGTAIALTYHREGAKIVCADIQDTSASGAGFCKGSEAVINEINSTGGSAIYVQTDVTKSEQVERLIQTAVEKYGRIDVMVNNAGVGTVGTPVWDATLEDWERVMAINATSVFLGTKFASAQMLKQEPHASGDRGWIINTASIVGLVGTEGVGSYCASKAAVVNFTRTAALDCAPHRIHVNAVCPGYTATAMTSRFFDDPQAKQDLIVKHGFDGRLGEPEDIANAFLFLASPDARWVTGVALPVDGGYTAR